MKSTPPHRRARRICALAAVAMLAPLVQGCASIAESITRSINKKGDEEPRACEVTGPAFEGIEARLRNQEAARKARGGADPDNPQRLKLLLVHGIGTHPPGWSTRLQRTLSAALDLSVLDETTKTFELRSLWLDGTPVGQLTVLRFTNETRTRELLTYELSWSSITEDDKKDLAYDTAGGESYRRAEVNQALKSFFNDRLADPLIYQGEAHELILESASEAMCWMAKTDWGDLPKRSDEICVVLDDADPRQLAEDEFVFITHSLGSRIVSDTLQVMASTARRAIADSARTAADRAKAKAFIEVLQEKDIRVYMLANQLPLLELAAEPREVTGRIPAYCERGGKHYADRIFAETFFVAYSDPNDPLSYALPDEFADEFMDSRICPRIVNVNVNVTKVSNLFGVGEVAHPLKAHTEYEVDPRVIGIMVGGIGTDGVVDVVREECTWAEQIDDGDS